VSALQYRRSPTDNALLTRTVDAESVAAVGKYFASEFRDRCLGEAFPSADFFHEFDGDLVKELQCCLSERSIISLRSS
jgi:hypothetical protein